MKTQTSSSEFPNNSESEPLLESCQFTFSQEPNCLSDTTEQIEVYFQSSLGLDREEDGFFTLKTEQWSVDSVEEINALFNRIKRVLNKEQ